MSVLEFLGKKQASSTNDTKRIYYNRENKTWVKRHNLSWCCQPFRTQLLWAVLIAPSVPKGTRQVKDKTPRSDGLQWAQSKRRGLWKSFWAEDVKGAWQVWHTMQINVTHPEVINHKDCFQMKGETETTGDNKEHRVETNHSSCFSFLCSCLKK